MLTAIGSAVPQDADDHPELYYLTRDDLQVISRPFAPRPANGSRKAVRAFAGLHGLSTRPGPDAHRPRWVDSETPMATRSRDARRNWSPGRPRICPDRTSHHMTQEADAATIPNEVAPGVTRLPGWTALQLSGRAVAVTWVGIAVGALIMFESYFPGKWYYWGGSFFVVATGIVITGETMSVGGNHKAKKERANGYTTALYDARRYPELYYLTGDDLQIVSPPFSARPEDGRRKVVRAFADLPNEPLYRTRRGRPAIRVEGPPAISAAPPPDGRTGSD